MTDHKFDESPAVATEQLVRQFGERVAVDGISISVASGSVFGLLGPNGAGKTTTIKMLTTLLPITSGSATVAGFDVAQRPYDVRRSIGYVPQMPSADGDLTARENLLIFSKLYGLGCARRASTIKDALELMDLTASADVLVKNFSGGMIRRLEIAQSMLHEPAVLFLDEPTIGLDPAARQTVWRHVRSVRERFQTTIFLTTHYMEEAEDLCGTVAFMRQGKIARIGSPKELRAAVGANATLDDVFLALSENTPEGGNLEDVLSARRAAKHFE